MNKWIKICLIAGGVCVIAGGVVTGAGAAMGAGIGSDMMFRYRNSGRNLVSEIMDDSIYDAMDDMRDSMDDAYDDLRDMKADLSQAGEDMLWSRDTEPEYDGSQNLAEEFDWGAQGQPGNYMYTYTPSSVQKLEVELKCGKAVVIQDHTVSEIIVSSNDEENRWSTELDGDTLEVKALNGSWGSGDTKTPVIYIQVPETFRFDEVKIETKPEARTHGYGKNRIPEFSGEGLMADKIEVNTKVGSVGLKGVNAKEVDLKSDVGLIYFEGSVTGDMDAECNVGEIQAVLAEKQETFNYEINCKVGAITVGSDSYAGVSGKEKIDNSASRKMELDCNVGSIEIKYGGN